MALGSRVSRACLLATSVPRACGLQAEAGPLALPRTTQVVADGWVASDTATRKAQPFALRDWRAFEGSRVPRLPHSGVHNYASVRQALVMLWNRGGVVTPQRKNLKDESGVHPRGGVLAAGFQRGPGMAPLAP